MPHSISIFVLLFSLLNPSLGDNTSAPTSSTPPPPARLFTAAVFLTPSTAGKNGTVSGVTLRAQNGSSYLDPTISSPSTSKYAKNCPPDNETVMWVDRWGQAWLDSANPQQIFLTTTTGTLSYLSPATSPPHTFNPCTIVTSFLHLGVGTAISVPIPDAPSAFANIGPGTLEWIGTAASGNPSWFACPRTGLGYALMKNVGGAEDWDRCVAGLKIVAVDSRGEGVAAGVYL